MSDSIARIWDECASNPGATLSANGEEIVAHMIDEHRARTVGPLLEMHNPSRLAAPRSPTFASKFIHALQMRVKD